MAAAAPVAPPPSAPPPGVTIVDTGPPKPPPAPTAQIRVSEMPAPSDPALLNPKGKAFDRLRADLAKKAKPSSFEAAPSPEPPAPTHSQEAPASGDPRPTDPLNAPEGAPADPEGAPSSDTPPPVAEKAKRTDEKGNKVSPWKLVDQFKERVAKAEARVLELEKQLLPEADRKIVTERLTASEKRTQELEEEIRHVNYEKSQEYQEKYLKPHQDAWKRAMAELGELVITVNGQQRQVTADDILQLVQAPLGRAREIANQVFGDFADDVMGHRKEIRNLYDAQSKALEDARKNGAEREKARNIDLKNKADELQSFISTTWERANSGIQADEKIGKFFKPVEGDQEGNQRLAKGYELVDRAFNEKSDDPRLTPEQRASVIKRHAAVRNRAAAFGRLVYQNGQLEARVAELQKQLDGFKRSSPPAGGSQPAPETPAVAGTAMGRVLENLRKIAKPA